MASNSKAGEDIDAIVAELDGTNIDDAVKKAKKKNKKERQKAAKAEQQQQQQESGEGQEVVNGESSKDVTEEGDKGKGKRKRNRNKNAKKDEGEEAAAAGGQDCGAGKAGGKGSGKGKKQTDPPSIAIKDLFPNGQFPVGQIMEYKDGADGTMAKDRLVGPFVAMILKYSTMRVADLVRRRSARWTGRSWTCTTR